MKRLTATEKWEKAWFRALPLKQKCLWSYLCDRCDCAGVWEPDFALASFQIGEAVIESDLGPFQDRVVKLPSGKFLVRGFVDFQYGKLSTSSRVHASILKKIDEHGLIKVGRDYCLGTDPVPESGSDSASNITPDSKVQVQVQEKVQVQGGCGGKNPNLVAAAAEMDRLFAQYSKLPLELGRYDRIWFDLIDHRFLPADVEVYLRWVIHENGTRSEAKYKTKFHVPKMFSDLQQFAADVQLAKAWSRNTPKTESGPDRPARTAAQILPGVMAQIPRPSK